MGVPLREGSSTMEKELRNNNKYYYRKKRTLFMRRKVYYGKIFLWWEGSSIMKTEFYLLLEGSSGIEKFHYKTKALLWKRAPL